MKYLQQKGGANTFLNKENDSEKLKQHNNISEVWEWGSMAVKDGNTTKLSYNISVVDKGGLKKSFESETPTKIADMLKECDDYLISIEK